VRASGAKSFFLFLSLSLIFAITCRTPLTIPLQITLSDFKLSGFVILVFSKQKGITVVFRNDPLESLKVSSTFDSIPFVRDFLQKEIEAQLRILFMDELPAIIHRLSLRLWVPEYRAGEDIKTQNDNTESTAEGPGQDPLASPPQDPVDAMGNALNESEIASLSLDSSVETHSLFSQKNLLRLAALTDSQRTLSLFTPSIQEVVYRAWTSPVDPSEAAASIVSPLSPVLSRTHSQIGSMASSIHETASVTSSHSRPSLSSAHSFSSYGLNLGTGRHSKAHSRRRKKRVVDLRRPKTTDDAMSVSDDSAMTESSGPPSIYSAPLPVVNEQSDDPVTPPLSPETDSHLPIIPERYRTSVSRPTLRRSTLTRDNEDPSYSVETIRPSKAEDVEATPRATVRGGYQNEKAEAGPSSGTARPPLPATILPFTKEDNPTGDSVDSLLVERLAGEIARRIREEKLMANNACSNFWSRAQDDAPPPAYGH
jgi:distribution and morphology protein 34